MVPVDTSHLLKRITENDEIAFRDLYNFFAPKLIELAYYYTDSSQLAGEVVSDVFVKIWKNRQSLGDINDIRSYLFVATKRQSISALRRENKKFLSLEVLHMDLMVESKYPDQDLITAEFLRFFGQCVKKLPSKTQLIFKLVKEDGIKYKDVAELLNLSPKTVEMHMTKALRHLRLQIQQFEGRNSGS